GSSAARAIPLAPGRAAVWRGGRLDGRRLPRAAPDGCAAGRRTRLAEAGDRTMTTWLVVSFGLALIAGAATTILIASWPRRVTAEEWIVRRRQASTPRSPKARAGWLLRVRLPSRWAEQAGYREATQEVERDLRLAQLARFAALPSSPEQLIEWLAKAGLTGAIIGLLLAIFLWRAGITDNPWAAVFLMLLV